jgi:hypothetical protein
LKLQKPVTRSIRGVGVNIRRSSQRATIGR